MRRTRAERDKKFHIETNFSKLDELIKSLGIIEKPIELTSQPLGPLDKVDEELKKGISIGKEDLEITKGFITHKGKLVLLYIDDHLEKSKEELETTPDSGKRYHIYDCSTLSQMRTAGRFDTRYILTNDTSGIFRVKTNDGPANIPLKICLNCLVQLRYKKINRSNKWIIRDSFDLSEYFREYIPKFKSLPNRSI